MLWLLTAPRYQYLTPVSYHQWRRSVEKSGGQGQSGQAIKPFQITSYVDDFQTLDNPGSCRRLKKLVLPSIFDASISSLMMWNLQSYPTTVLNERTWHDISFFGGQNILRPLLHIFRGSGHPLPGSTLLNVTYGSVRVLFRSRKFGFASDSVFILLCLPPRREH